MTRTVWVVTDGAAGNERQASALAHRLGTVVATLGVQPRWPYSWLAPQLLVPTAAWRNHWPSPWPELAVGAGRFGAAALRTIARSSSAKTVQILDPRVASEKFSALVVPAHDAVRGANVVRTLGSLHDIDNAWLKRERIACAAMSRLPAPRTVVLLGGPRRGVAIDRSTFARLTDIAHGWRRDGSLILVTSRRTPPAWLDALKELRADLRWTGAADGPNPYRGALAWGDRFIVTADSVNMQSEALATGKPVFSVCNGVPRGKLGRFHRELAESGRLRPLRADAASWSYVPLRELDRVVAELMALLA